MSYREDECLQYRLKCNREKPCQNCITRNEQRTCNFRGVSNGSGNKVLPHLPADDMQQRIDHLENLVKTLMVQIQEGLGMKSSHPIDDDVARLDAFTSKELENGLNTESSFSDRTVVNKDHSIYKNPNDWSAVLKEVHHLPSFSLTFEDHKFLIQTMLPNYEIIS
jgi:hypothetical protein